MVIDVGVLFKAVDPLKPVNSIPMVIPAKIVKQVDLSSEVRDSNNARLVFGKRFSHSTSDELHLHRSPAGTRAITVSAVAEKKRAGKLELIGVPDAELTALRIDVPSAPADKPVYIRVRFVVDGSANMFRWLRVLGRRGGAVVDLRVHDPREGGTQLSTRAEIDGLDLPVEEMDAFFMLPERFLLAATNPPLAYTRTLEPERWRGYLRRYASGWFVRERLLVHRFSNHDAVTGQRTAINAATPFRGYMQFERTSGFRPVSDLVLPALLATLLIYGLFGPLALRSGPAEVFDRIGDVLGSELVNGIKNVYSLGVIGAASLVLGRIRKVRAAYRSLKRAFKEVEYRYFKAFGR